MKRELQDLLWSEIATLTFEINAALRNFSENVQEYDDTIPELLRAVQIHEVPLIVIFPKDGSAGKLILHMIKHASFAELGDKNGLSMNGKVRAWTKFVDTEIENIAFSNSIFGQNRKNISPACKNGSVWYRKISWKVKTKNIFSRFLCDTKNKQKPGK
jgi:hypothetical protein